MEGGSAYSDFKIHHLLRKRAHLIVKAEPILADIICREHKISLSFLRSIQYNLVCGPDDAVVDVE
jgi:hypothetical protein